MTSPIQAPVRGRAAIADARGSFAFEDIEVDAPGSGEVLVEMRASGVCHTDLDHVRSSADPHVIGHEGAGVVAAVGPDIDRIAPGDAVVLNWAIPCGACFQCLRGDESICESKPLVPHERTRLRGTPLSRSFELGTMSTHSVVRQEAVVRIGAEVPFASAAIVGCGVMTGVGSVLNAAKVEAGSLVVVLGTGGVGLNVVQGARLARAARIIAVDTNPARLEMARRFGATDCVQADRSDTGLLAAAAQVRALTAGRGADYAFECTAIPELGAAPLAMVRHGGMALQLSGIEQTIAFDAELFEWNKVYLNPLYGMCRPQIDFPRLFDWYRAGELELDGMVTRTYALEELGQAFEDMCAGRNAKGVIVF